jgi:hypothetical protein
MLSERHHFSMALKEQTAPGELAHNRWVVRSAQLFLGAWFVFYLINALNTALWFNGAPADGPFEIFDPLRRIAAGQTPGRDFIQYHGIGVPYLHYPLFALFGGKTLTASELSRQFTSIALFVLSLGAFAWITLRRASQVWIGMASSVLFMEALFPLELRAASPGNSVVMARSTIPVFAFAAMQLPLRNSVKAILVGCCIGLAFVFGTEHGIGLTLALTLVAAVTLTQTLFGKRTQTRTASHSFAFATIALGTALVSAAAFLCLVGGVDGALKAVHYTLVELPADQFWFTTGPPLPYLSAWSQLIFDRHAILCLLPVLFTAGVLVWMLFQFRNRPVPLGKSWQALATFMLAYGLLSCVAIIGSLSKHYLLPLTRILSLVGLVLFAHKAQIPAFRRPAFVKWKGWQLVPGAFRVICLTAAAALATSSSVVAYKLVRHLRTESPAYNLYFGERWDSFMAQATALLDSRRTRPHMSLWSPYSALLESHYAIFLPVDDYIIHSSGAQRWPNYISTFQASDPEFVQTLTQDFDFEEWLQDGKWEFYEAVLDNYEPIRRVGHALFWQRTNQAWRQPSSAFRTLALDSQSRYVNLPFVTAGPDQIAVVRVRYHIVNPWKWLPILGNTPRYLAIPEGTPRRLPVSFPPYELQFQFPVQIPPGKLVKLHFKTESLLPGVTLLPEQVQVKILEWRPALRAIYARESVGIIHPNSISITR